MRIVNLGHVYGEYNGRWLKYVLANLIRPVVPLDDVVEVGCGKAHMREVIGDSASYIGVDSDAIHSSPDIVGDASMLPIPSGSSGVVMFLGLDAIGIPGALDEARRVLVPEGYIVLMYNSSFYEDKVLCDVVKDKGFEVVDHVAMKYFLNGVPMVTKYLLARSVK